MMPAFSQKERNPHYCSCLQVRLAVGSVTSGEYVFWIGSYEYSNGSQSIGATFIAHDGMGSNEA